MKKLQSDTFPTRNSSSSCTGFDEESCQRETRESKPGPSVIWLLKLSWRNTCTCLCSSFLCSVVQGFGVFAYSGNCISVVNEIIQILGTGMYTGNTLAYKIIHVLPWGMGNGSCLFSHLLIWRKTWRENIKTKGIREIPFVVSVVKDGKLSLGDFYSILFKGYNLDQDSWLLL